MSEIGCFYMFCTHLLAPTARWKAPQDHVSHTLQHPYVLSSHLQSSFKWIKCTIINFVIDRIIKKMLAYHQFISLSLLPIGSLNNAFPVFAFTKKYFVDFSSARKHIILEFLYYSWFPGLLGTLWSIFKSKYHYP